MTENSDLVIKTLFEIKETVGGIKERVESVDQKVDTTNASVNNHELRLQKLETFQNRLLTYMGIAGIVITAATSFVTAWLRDHLFK